MRLSSRLTLRYLISLSLLIVFVISVFAGVSYLPKSNVMRRGVGDKPSDVLTLIAENTKWDAEGVNVSAEVLEQTIQNGEWLQILDGEGRKIYSYNTPTAIPKAYAPGELIAYRMDGEAFGYQIYTWFEEDQPQRLTWIYGKQYEESIYNSYILWALVLVVCGLFTAIIGLVFGMYLGRPLIQLLNWIDAISKNQYGEPLSRKGLSVFRKPQTDKLRWSYRTYEEIIDAIKILTQHLAESERQRVLLDQAREEWIAGVSHDMKTPLSSVKGYADLMASDSYGLGEEEVKAYAQIISDKAMYMEKLIEDLNLTCRLSHNALPIQCKKKDLLEIVRRSVIDLINNERCKGKNISLEVEEDAQFFYEIDEKWFRRAFDNLLINAVTHTEDGTNITITFEEVEEAAQGVGVKLTIADDGAGISEEVMSHIFDRYYRGTSTAEYAIKGSGLGLAIAKQLIEAHDGTVTAQSEKYKGTTFTIVLPPQN